MLGAAFALTLVTLTGLAAGLAREWLLVNAWGAGAQADAFLVAAFIPEAVRTVLAGGLLSSAALALWQVQTAEQRPAWLGSMSTLVGGAGLALAVLFALFAPWWVRVIGPGLSPASTVLAANTLSLMAWSLPAMALQAIWSVPMQARGHFILAGLGSLLYNLPAVLYMVHAGRHTQPNVLAWMFVTGSVLMMLVLLPAMWRIGLRVRSLGQNPLAHGRALAVNLTPLMGSAFLSQGIFLLERMAASLLGEGVVTVLNLARKLLNLPLLALMAVNQVLLGLMSRSEVLERQALLRQGLVLVTTVSAPAAIGLLLAAPALVALLFPQVHAAAVLTQVLGWYAVALVLSSWIQLWTRYSHAGGDTHLPFWCELGGAVVQVVALFVLPLRWGEEGLAVAALLGLSVQGGLLWWRSGLHAQVAMGRLLVVSAGLLMASAVWARDWLLRWADQPWLVLGVVTLGCMVSMAMLAIWWRPWQTQR
jgi:murein biosynthesis integral membrane protein MurJ